MSRETLDWLNENTLIGFTAERGNAWHYRAGATNHYDGPVPIEAVRGLFAWEPVVQTHTYTYDGRTYESDRVNVIRPGTGDLLGVHSSGYTPHGYSDWLLQRVESLLDDSLSIGSAGLLKLGAVAWVQVEMPETVVVASVGEAIRPHLLAVTSLDGSIATTYKRALTRVVCDNTLSGAIAEQTSQMVRVKHTRNSLSRLDVLTSRDALGIVYEMGDAFGKAIEELCSRTVTDAQWTRFLELHLGERPDDQGRTQTLYDTKRDRLQELYRTDPRVAPWSGTSWGVLQAVNTYAHHDAAVRNMPRPLRNMARAVGGEWDTLDGDTISQLDLILS
jgi:phage/plasmid-like protein (TIGR03299 family)